MFEHRGSAQEAGGGMGGGTADTPRVTIAMVTHEVPGDSFWDLIRKGAETAAKKDNIELRYSNDPEAPNQANLVQTAVDSGVKGIAVTLAKPDAMAGRGEGCRGQGHPRGGLQRRTQGLAGDGRARSTSARTATSRDRSERWPTRRAPNKGDCVIEEQGHVDLEARCAGLKSTFPTKTENLKRNAERHRPRSSRRSPRNCNRIRASTTS